MVMLITSADDTKLSTIYYIVESLHYTGTSYNLDSSERHETTKLCSYSNAIKGDR